MAVPAHASDYGIDELSKKTGEDRLQSADTTNPGRLGTRSEDILAEAGGQWITRIARLIGEILVFQSEGHETTEAL